MESIPHALHKILLERACSNTTLPIRTSDPTVPPPPAYTEHIHDILLSSSNSFLDAEEIEEEDEDTDATTLTLHADTVVRGRNNVVSLASSPLADATRFSALLLSAVQKINEKAAEGAAKVDGQGGSESKAGKQPVVVKVNFVINAGLKVLGDGNVVGNVPVRKAVGGGAKRARDGEEAELGEGEAKRTRL